MKLSLIKCPNCGAELEFYEYDFNKNVVCSYCDSLIRIVDDEEIEELWIKKRYGEAYVRRQFKNISTSEKTFPNMGEYVTKIDISLFYVPYYYFETGVVTLTNENEFNINKNIATLCATNLKFFHLPSNYKIKVGTSIYGHGTPIEFSKKPFSDGVIVSPEKIDINVVEYFGKTVNENLFLPHIEFISPRKALIYYPFYILKYRIFNTLYEVVVDGYSGELIFYSAPGRLSGDTFRVFFTTTILGLGSAVFIKAVRFLFFKKGFLPFISNDFFDHMLFFILFFLPFFIFLKLPKIFTSFIFEMKDYKYSKEK